MQRNILRWFSLVLAGLFMFGVLCACQPTPEEPPVIGRQEDILDVVETIEPDKFEKIEVPGRFEGVFEPSKMVVVTYDADVIVPDDCDMYPVVEMKPRIFSDSDIMAMLKTLTGNENVELYSEYNRSKADWMHLYGEAKAHEGTEKVTGDYLDFLMKQYNSASTDERAEAFDINTLEEGLPQTVYVKNSDGVISTVAMSRNAQTFWYSRSDYGVSTGYFENGFTEDQFDSGYETREQFLWRKPSEEADIPKEQAYKAALETIESLDVDLELNDDEKCSILYNSVNKSTGWTFYFARRTGGLKALKELNDTCAFKADENGPSYGSAWGEERVTITIDANGEVYGFRWEGASAISETVAESAKLISFEFLIERINKQFGYTFVWSDPTLPPERVIVKKIELGTSMIAVKDRADRGVFVPSWYVTYALESSADDTTCIFFNAVDGSYIEPRITNKDLMEAMGLRH